MRNRLMRIRGLRWMTTMEIWAEMAGLQQELQRQHQEMMELRADIAKNAETLQRYQAELNRRNKKS